MTNDIEKTRKEAYKFNLIELAKHHRKYCEGEECYISLILLMQIAEKLGIEFSDKEKELSQKTKRKNHD